MAKIFLFLAFLVMFPGGTFGTEAQEALEDQKKADFLWELRLQALEGNRVEEAELLSKIFLRLYPQDPRSLELVLASSPRSKTTGLGASLTLWTGQILWGLTSGPFALSSFSPQADLQQTSLAALLGLGLGITSGWFYSSDQNLSLGTVLWMETLPWIVTLNVTAFESNRLARLASEPTWEQTAVPWTGVTNFVAGWGTGLLTWSLLKDRDPSLGTYGGFLNLYGTSLLYSQFLLGLPFLDQWGDPGVRGWMVQGLGLGGGLSIFLLQPGLRWSWERHALVGVGGLTAWGAAALTLLAVGSPPLEGWENLIWLASHGVGMGIAAWLTSGFFQETEEQESLPGLPAGVSLSLSPVFSQEAFGFKARVSW